MGELIVGQLCTAVIKINMSLTPQRNLVQKVVVESEIQSSL